MPRADRAIRLPPAAARRLRPLARIVAGASGRLTGSGPPAIFTTLGRHPRLFRAWLIYSAQLMPFGTLPRRDAELVILRVACRCREAYEWWHHVPLALRAGLRPDEIAAAGDASPTTDLCRRDQVLLAMSDEVLAQRRLSDGTWQAVRTMLTDREVVEACLLIGHYQGLASAIGALGIQLENDA